MCATVLLNLLNSLLKSDKILCKPHILSLFLNMFDSVIHEHSCKILYVVIRKFAIWSEVIKIFMLNSTEHEIYHAHNC